MRWLLPDAEQPYELLERCREWLEPHFINERGHLLQSVHSFVVEAAGQTIVVDTGVGNDKNREGGLEPWHMRDGPFLDDLEAAGFPPQSVDLVVATHMHGEHVGWNTRLVDGEWVPTFPNARYLWVDHEWEHMTELSEQAGGDSELMKNSLRPVFDAGRVELVLPDHRVSDGVWFEPTHGHTPGHVFHPHLFTGGGGGDQRRRHARPRSSARRPRSARGSARTTTGRPPGRAASSWNATRTRA